MSIHALCLYFVVDSFVRQLILYTQVLNLISEGILIHWKAKEKRMIAETNQNE